MDLPAAAEARGAVLDQTNTQFEARTAAMMPGRLPTGTTTQTPIVFMTEVHSDRPAFGARVHKTITAVHQGISVTVTVIMIARKQDIVGHMFRSVVRVTKPDRMDMGEIERSIRISHLDTQMTCLMEVSLLHYRNKQYAVCAAEK